MPKDIRTSVDPDSSSAFASLADFRPRKPSVKLTSKWVTIKTEWHGKHDSYHFALNRIDTRMKLLHWVRHLTGKVWFDQGVTCELIEKVCNHFGWDLNVSV